MFSDTSCRRPATRFAQGLASIGQAGWILSLGAAISLWTVLITLLQAPSVSAAEPGPWYQRCLVGLEVGPTGAQFGSDPSDRGYAAEFDGREVVRRTVAAQAEYLVIWARDGEYAYYDSQIMPKCPGLGARDVLRETMEAAGPHQLPVIAYCVVQQGGQFLRDHPEMAMRDAAGHIIPGRYCLNSPYRDVMKRLLDEQLAYGIAGFHIDMIDQGFGPPVGCWCPHCQSKFQARYDSAMPSGVTWDEAWRRMLDFRYWTSTAFEKELYDHVRSRNPAATVDFNYHGNPPFSWEVGQRPVQHAGNADFVTGETGVWGFSALGVGLNAQFYKAATPGHPVQVAMQRGVRMYHDQTTRPLHDLRWELLTLLAHGAFVTIVDKTAYDGWLDPVAYERFGQAFREVHAKRDHFGQDPVADVGLYFSALSRDWYAQADPPQYFQAFQGAHRALEYAHIPWGVVLDENVDLATLQRFPVILLCNTAVISEPELGLLRQYVEGGGRLLITGHSGLFDSAGRPQAESALQALIGARAAQSTRFAGQPCAIIHAKCRQPGLRRSKRFGSNLDRWDTGRVAVSCEGSRCRLRTHDRIIRRGSCCVPTAPCGSNKDRKVPSGR